MENKKDNFKRISENRVSKIKAPIVVKEAYTDDEIERIFKAIDEEAKKSKEHLLKSNDKKRKNKRFEL